MSTLPANAVLQDRKWVRLSDGTSQADIGINGIDNGY